MSYTSTPHPLSLIQNLMPETSVAQRHSPTLVYRDWGDTTRVQLRDFSPLLPWRATEVWVWQVLGGVSVFQATGKHWQPKSCEATLEIQLPLKYSMKYCISSWVCIGPFYWLSKVVGFCFLGVFLLLHILTGYCIYLSTSNNCIPSSSLQCNCLHCIISLS